MVMNWNSEADAKLFQGVLNLLRDSKIKLDYEYLAGFMGPGSFPPLKTTCRLYYIHPPLFFVYSSYLIRNLGHFTHSTNSHLETDCLPGAVQNRIVRLKRMAEKGPSNDDSASGENVDEKTEGAGSEGQAQASPAKRKGGRPRGVKGSLAKKVKATAKAKVEVEEEDDEEM
ncbi:hypothetical protein ASPCAL04289 [Aspergillus calidoustus]|uniref:Uncharacterized protein n=1 Tax=Aspergillus calidoustus TaxID=454130 RepID=A0A0U5C517_ASPCI|nr:hypothetical protein ASPCAL04289 [Aspergillus calidoustus]